jgi:2-keto-3-deoxy-L-rhamnonate aldolase RhmA
VRPPARWDLVAGVVGDHSAREMQRALGGRRLAIPKPGSSAAATLTLLIGHAALEALNEIGVQQVYVPMLPDVDETVLAAEACAWLEAGARPATVARALGRSDRWAYRLAARSQETSHAA